MQEAKRSNWHAMSPRIASFERKRVNVFLLYSLYAVRVAHAILYAFLVANHSTRSTLKRNFGPNLKENTRM